MKNCIQVYVITVFKAYGNPSKHIGFYDSLYNTQTVWETVFKAYVIVVFAAYGNPLKHSVLLQFT